MSWCCSSLHGASSSNGWKIRAALLSKEVVSRVKIVILLALLTLLLLSSKSVFWVLVVKAKVLLTLVVLTVLQRSGLVPIIVGCSSGISRDVEVASKLLLRHILI